MTRSLPSLAAGALALAVTAVAETGTEWREREGPERFEGVLIDEMVSGSDVQLLGVQVVGGAGGDAPAGEVLHLVAPERMLDELSVEVRELPSNYLMKPKRRATPSAHFQWSRREVVEPAGLSVSRLCALASNELGSVYYPVYLGSSAELPDPAWYRFAFYVRAPHALLWTVYREHQGELVELASGEGDGEEGLVEILWYGRDAAGTAAAPAERHLLRVRFELYANTTRRPPPLEVPFETLPASGPGAGS